MFQVEKLEFLIIGYNIIYCILTIIQKSINWLIVLFVFIKTMAFRTFNMVKLYRTTLKHLDQNKKSLSKIILKLILKIIKNNNVLINN
jgi:hypothetical protein